MLDSSRAETAGSASKTVSSNGVFTCSTDTCGRKGNTSMLSVFVHAGSAVDETFLGGLSPFGLV